MSLKDFFDSCDNHTDMHNGTSFTIEWSRKGTGFGSFTFYKKGNRIHCDSECMSRRFVKEVLRDLVDTAVFDDEERDKQRKKQHDE